MQDVDVHAQYGRYIVYGEFASGGMATVHAGRMLGTRNFSLTVAVKRLRRELATDARFVTMFVDEARLVSRIRHPNVVPTLDVVEERGEILIVMEYVHGESLGRLLAQDGREGEPPLPVVSRILCDVLQGLHAAHEAKSEQGLAMDIVHRDVSPQNVLVGEDGIARVVDFGIAKAIDHGHRTATGELKGKLRYFAPEQFGGDAVDRRTDIYAAGVILWEAVTGARLRPAVEPAKLMRLIMSNDIPLPSSIVPDIAPELDDVVMRALRAEPSARFAFASQMADALARAVPPASHTTVGEWVHETAASELQARRAYLAEVERSSTRPAPFSMSESGRQMSASGTPSPVDARNSGYGRRFALVGSVTLILMAGVFVIRYGITPPVRAYARLPPPQVEPVPTAEPSAAVVTRSSVDPGPQVQVSSPSASAAVRRAIDRRVPTAPPSQSAKAAHKTAAPPDCQIPFTLDQEGVRIPRPECE